MALKTKSQRSPKRNYVVILGFAFLLFVLNHFHLINFQELAAVDLRFILRGSHEAHPDIVFVQIDDHSIHAAGQWPWPRTIHAVLLDVLRNYEPRLVFMDMLFTEASPSEEDDIKFSYAIEKSANIILPFFFYSEKPFDAFFPIRSLRESARDIGFVNITPDLDGRIRRMRISVAGDDQTYYSIPILSMLSQFVDEEKAQSWLDSIPSDKTGQFWINFPGPADVIQRISFAELINATGSNRDTEMRELFKDKIVMVGLTATGATTDLKATPFSSTYPGTAVVASALHTLLTEKYLRPVHWSVHLLLLLIVSFSIARITEISTPRRGLLVTLAVLAVFILLNFALFFFAGLIMLLVVPVVVIIMSYVLMLFMQFLEIHFQREILSRELNMAATIQVTFLPSTQPETDKIEVAFQCKFAKQVGGDLYDWVDLGEGRFGVCVGDVSGKGVPAAIYMARTISDFRRECLNSQEPEEVISAVNNILCEGGTSGMFVTLLYAVIDTEKRTMKFCNAGHEDLLVYRYNTIQAEVIEGAKCPPIGIFSNAPYLSQDVEFKQGDSFVIYSDGIKELRSAKGEEFGLDRLRSLMEEHGATRSAGEVIQIMFKELGEFQRGVLPHDDQTLMCVKFTQ